MLPFGGVEHQVTAFDAMQSVSAQATPGQSGIHVLRGHPELLGQPVDGYAQGMGAYCHRNSLDGRPRKR